MANVIADQLPFYFRDETAPLGIKLVALWAGLKAVPLVVFAGFMIQQTLAAESVSVFGIGLLVLAVLGALAYAAAALITALGLWTLTKLGVRGAVGIASLSMFMNIFFVGSKNTVWILGFLPELYPLVVLDLAIPFALPVFVLGILINGGAASYVLTHNEEFL